MTMPTSLQNAIVKTITRYSDGDVCESRVDLALQCIRSYQAQFKYIPEEWLEYMRKMIAKRLVWEQKLLATGEYTLEQVKALSFGEVREELEAHEFMEVTSGTATGGSTTTRVPLKKAA